MQRSRLRNIINKSKEISNKKELVGDPFDKFILTLPKELLLNENYRMKAAWKAYGSPKDYKEALWEGLIQPIDENNFKLPSIGYNEETDEYEYLNKGQDNETVAKDIRVWDNDVIPFVKELKHGGYVRTFNEEKDCWTYTKNSQKREDITLTNELQINSFLNGGTSRKLKSYSEWIKDINPDYLDKDYDLEKAYNEVSIDKLEVWKKDPKNNHLPDDYKKPTHMTYSYPGYGWSGSDKEGWTFTISPELYELHGGNNGAWDKYVRYWNEHEPKALLQTWNGILKYRVPNFAEAISRMKDEYKPKHIEVPGSTRVDRPIAFKEGGQMNVIPEGALHARKNNMELAKEGEVTSKGIPVVDNNGELQAEIEREEIIFSKDTTEKIECFYKSFKEEGISESKKAELAIKCGKFLTDLILNNTDDKTGLIEEVKLNM